VTKYFNFSNFKNPFFVKISIPNFTVSNLLILLISVVKNLIDPKLEIKAENFQFETYFLTTR
jgi:hypothetical protein